MLFEALHRFDRLFADPLYVDIRGGRDVGMAEDFLDCFEIYPKPFQIRSQPAPERLPPLPCRTRATSPPFDREWIRGEMETGQAMDRRPTPARYFYARSGGWLCDWANRNAARSRSEENQAKRRWRTENFTIRISFLTQSRAPVLMGNLMEKCDKKPKTVVVTLLEGDQNQEYDRVSLDLERDFKMADPSAYTPRSEIVLSGLH